MHIFCLAILNHCEEKDRGLMVLQENELGFRQRQRVRGLSSNFEAGAE